MSPQEKAQKAYDDYYNVLRNGQVTADTIKQAYGEIDPGHVERVLKIKAEIDTQQAAGSKEYYSAGRISADNAAWDMAFRLSEMGLSSVYDMGKRTVSRDYGNDEGGNPLIGKIDEYYNKATGEDITDNWNSKARSGPLRTTYNLHFTDDGMAVPYTGKETSDWVKFRDSTLKPIAGIALAAYGVPYVSTAIAGTTVAGVTLTAGSALTTGVAAGMVSGGVSLLGGNSFEDALKSALTSGLTAGAAAGYADTIGQSLGFDAGSVASKAAGNAIIAGAKAGITDENILAEMAKSAVATYLSNKDDLVKASDEDLAAGLDPRYGSNETYDDFMTAAMTPEARAAIEAQIKVSDEDLAAGLDPRYGSNETYDDFMTESMTPEARAAIESQIDPSLMGPQTAEDLSKGFDQYITDSAFDATANQGSLVKEVEDVKEPESNLTTKDIKTAIKIGGVLMAGDEVIDRTIGGKDKQITGQPDSKDKYRNAPLAGFKMVKYDDPTSGGSKYIPFVGEEALLPPPSGYKRGYAKGGFVSKPIKSKGLASKR